MKIVNKMNKPPFLIEQLHEKIRISNEGIIFFNSHLFPEIHQATNRGEIIDSQGNIVGYLFINPDFEIVTIERNGIEYSCFLSDGRGFATSKEKGEIKFAFLSYPYRNFGVERDKIHLLRGKSYSGRISLQYIVENFATYLSTDKSNYCKVLEELWTVYDTKQNIISRLDTTIPFDVDFYRENPSREIFFLINHPTKTNSFQKAGWEILPEMLEIEKDGKIWVEVKPNFYLLHGFFQLNASGELCDKNNKVLGRLVLSCPKIGIDALADYINENEFFTPFYFSPYFPNGKKYIVTTRQLLKAPHWVIGTENGKVDAIPYNYEEFGWELKDLI
ncbi:MAG: hypothetical protein LUH04_18010 [Clostridium sp.]|nr:hypothetical protein [Clostridium sp.]